MPASAAGRPSPGVVLAGKYEVIREVAEGGMGVVFEARHVRLGHRVALKILRAEMRAAPEVALRFEREARAAAQIQGPHSVRVVDVDVLSDGSPLMVMEMLAGHDLGDEIDARGPLPASEAVGYLLEACAGMAEAHALGIVHRDLKPSNLFLAEEGGKKTLKVLDFGISKVMDDRDVKMTATASVLGTPLYMSPEQIRSAKHVDERTDIWSLGVILYEMLAGRPPFDLGSATAVAAAIVADDVPDIREHRSDLSDALASVVMKALEKKPDARFQSVAELAAALAPLSGETAASASGPAASLPAGGPRSARKVSPAAPTLERADTLAAPPAAASSAHATEPGWQKAAAAKRGPSFGALAAIATAALAIGVASWLAVREPAPPETVASAPRTDLPVIPDQAEPGAVVVTAASAAPPVEPSAAPDKAPAAAAPKPRASASAKPSAAAAAEAPPAAKTKAVAPAPAKNPLRL